MSGDIIQFPVVNKRHDVVNIALDPEEIAAKIKLMKLAYFASIADEIVDDVLRSMSMLKLEETPAETNQVDSKDVILLKEAIISTMCRIIGTSHPLHEIVDHELVLSEIYEDVNGFDVPYFKYRFKSEPEEALREEVTEGL